MRVFGEGDGEIPSSELRDLMRRHRAAPRLPLREAAALLFGLATAIAILWWAVTP